MKEVSPDLKSLVIFRDIKKFLRYLGFYFLANPGVSFTIMLKCLLVSVTSIYMLEIIQFCGFQLNASIFY